MESRPRENLSSFAAVMARQRRGEARRSGLSRLGDIGVIALGVVAALGSATFAGYMITSDNSNPQFVGAEHLMLFAQPIRTVAVPPVRIAGRIPAGPGVDFTPVGSIPATATTTDARPKNAAPVAGYVLREAHDGIAIVDGPHGSFEIIPGATLPDAGKVVAIERRAGTWRVVTENGTIGAQR